MRMTKQQLTDQTVDVWQSRTLRRLSNEDAREITENLIGFFSILGEWSRKEGRDSVDATSRRGVDACTPKPLLAPWLVAELAANGWRIALPMRTASRASR